MIVTSSSENLYVKMVKISQYKRWRIFCRKLNGPVRCPMVKKNCIDTNTAFRRDCVHILAAAGCDIDKSIHRKLLKQYGKIPRLFEKSLVWILRVYFALLFNLILQLKKFIRLASQVKRSLPSLVRHKLFLYFPKPFIELFDH